MSMLFNNKKAGSRLFTYPGLTALAMSCVLSTGLVGFANAQPQPVVAPAAVTEIAQPALFDAIASRARLLAKLEYKPIQANIPEALANINYDQYRSLRSEEHT